MFILNRFDILLHWLAKPNTILLLYPGLGPTINIGGVIQTSAFFLVILSRILSLNILLLKREIGLCLHHFRERRTKRTYTCIHNPQHNKKRKTKISILRDLKLLSLAFIFISPSLLSIYDYLLYFVLQFIFLYEQLNPFLQNYFKPL